MFFKAGKLAVERAAQLSKARVLIVVQAGKFAVVKLLQPLKA